MIHNDGRLRIGTVPLAVPQLSRTSGWMDALGARRLKAPPEDMRYLAWLTIPREGRAPYVTHPTPNGSGSTGLQVVPGAGVFSVIR